MKTMLARNVNEALAQATWWFQQEGWAKEVRSRGSLTLEATQPVATVYARPQERVLFCPHRDANPFFHLMESLWILAGREDTAWLKRYNPRIQQFSDDGITFHGAYGKRLWEKYQIKKVIELLRADPESRRAVLQIWNHWKDLAVPSRDIPCNTHIYLKVRDEALEMRVLCRSNDMIWGAYGANAVQFSMLQEYLACSLNVALGPLTQVSDSFHVYLDGASSVVWERVRNHNDLMSYVEPYDDLEPSAPLVVDPERWDLELLQFMSHPQTALKYQEPFFRQIAAPMARAHQPWFVNKTHPNPKVHRAEAIARMDYVEDAAWRRAGKLWLMRRKW